MSMSLRAIVLTAAGVRACGRWLALLLTLGLGVAHADGISLTSPLQEQNFVNQTSIRFSGIATSATASCRRVSVAMVIDGVERSCSAVASGVSPYSCTLELGSGGHLATAQQTISDALCGTGQVVRNYSSVVTFRVTRAPAVSVAINAPAAGSQLGQNSVTASLTASSNTLGGLQNGEKLRLTLFLDGVQVASAEGSGITLPLSAPLLLEGGKHTLVAKAQYLDSNNAQLTHADSSATFTIVPVNTSVLLIAPDMRDEGEQNIRRYDSKSGSFVGLFGGACHALDLSYGPDGKLYVLDSYSRFDQCRPTAAVVRFDGRTGAFDFEDEQAFYVYHNHGLDNPASMTFGPDGNLYIANNSEGNIHRYQGPYAPNPGQLIDIFVTPAEGHFEQASKIHFGPDGDLYLGDLGSNSILRYGGPASAAPGSYIGSFVTPGSGGLDGPLDFLFRDDGMLYVTSRNKVLRYAGPTQASPGRFLGEFSTVGAFLVGLAAGPGNSLYASGAGNDGYGVWRISGASGKSEGLLALAKERLFRDLGPLLLSSIPLPVSGLGDFDGDGCVDRSDFNELMAHIVGGVTSHPVVDLNGDGDIDIADVRKLTMLFSRPAGAPCR